MKRRDFSTGLASLGLGASTLIGPLVARAAESQAPAPPKAPSDSEYVRLSQPLSVEKGKIEVVEFFWYGCPPCFAFEPALDAWQKKLPSDVAFRRVPVAFRESYAIHQRLFYAIEAMGKVEELHRKAFYAIHVDKQRLNTDDTVIAWAASQGLDKAKFTETYNSFNVATKVRKATQLQDAYKLAGVPAIGVNGRYYTDGTLAQNMNRALTVTDQLIAEQRGKAKS